jgi:spectrin beta
VAAAAPLALRGSTCEFANDYTKKKNVIRLSLPDKSEYLFHTHDANEMLLWQTKIQFHAGKWRISRSTVQWVPNE